MQAKYWTGRKGEDNKAWDTYFIYVYIGLGEEVTRVKNPFPLEIDSGNLVLFVSNPDGGEGICDLVTVQN